MKKILFFSFLVIVLGGCLWVKPDEELNPPNMDQMLRDAEVTLAMDLAGADVSITTTLWLQQIKGLSGTALLRYNYSYPPSETIRLWSDLYIKVMKNLDSVEQLAQQKNAYYYEAVAKIMFALALGNTTDLFGDIPYSEHFSLDTPEFVSQKQLYQVIFDKLDEAIEIIDNGNPGEVPLGYGDVVYGWDMDKWRKAAYTLKARYLMHLINVEQVDYNQVLSYLQQGFSSNDDDMKITFYQVGEIAPIYKYVSETGGLGNNAKFQDLLGKYKDPRVMALAYNGFWARQIAYFPFVQYTEALFLKSEAYWREGAEEQAKEALKDAVKASLDKYIVSAPDWYADYCVYVDSLTYDTLLYEIAIQKYIDQMYHPEAYNDWRRLKIPYLKPIVGDTIPQRLPYSQEELDRNANAPDWGTDVDLFTPVWWEGSVNK